MQTKIRELFHRTKADKILIRTTDSIMDSNMEYFTQMHNQGTENRLLLLEAGKTAATLIQSPLESAQIQKPPWIRTKSFSKAGAAQKFLNQKLRNKKIGLNFESYPVSRYRWLQKNAKPKQILDVSKAFGEIRAIKTKAEQKNLATAARITTEIFERLPALLKKSRTEQELAEALKQESEKNGTQLSYPPIVAMKTNSAIPHHNPGSRTLRTKGILLVDFGVRFNGYCADLTRTGFIGKPPAKISAEYEIVYKARALASSLLQTGNQSGKIFEEVNAFLKTNTGRGLIHALGHGIGIDVHDYPNRIAEKETWKIAENQCLAIEPATYKPAYGIRIEDDFIIKNGKAKPLSEAPAELICL